MSFQAYLDNIELKIGKTPTELIDEASKLGFTKDTKAGDILQWLKENYDLGRGHGMAIVYGIKNGATISDTHVGSGSTHSDESTSLRLDGIDS